MDKNDARYFAGMMEEFLEIPSFVCETIEQRLMVGKYEEVCKFIVNRHRELNGDER